MRSLIASGLKGRNSLAQAGVFAALGSVETPPHRQGPTGRDPPGHPEANPTVHMPPPQRLSFVVPHFSLCPRHEPLSNPAVSLDSRRPAQRDRQFAIDVLENFRYSCAFCGFHAVLNGQATASTPAISIGAHTVVSDEVDNGIALCKLHHWAFNKGILGIDNEQRIGIADAFVAQQDAGMPLESLVNRPLAVQPPKSSKDPRGLVPRVKEVRSLAFVTDSHSRPPAASRGRSPRFPS